MAIKRFCDQCQQEIEDKNFSFEAILRQIKYPSSVLTAGQQAKPLFVEQNMHLCRKCYIDKFEKSEENKEENKSREEKA